MEWPINWTLILVQRGRNEIVVPRRAPSVHGHGRTLAPYGGVLVFCGISVIELCVIRQLGQIAF